MKDNLSQRTAEMLKTMILKEQRYLPGQKLPNENELSELLGISRTTLRETIRILVSDGLLEVRPKKGTFVTEEYDRFIQGSPAFQEFTDLKITLRELYEARMIIEPEAAFLACKRASDEEIEEILRLGEICQSFLKEKPAGEKRIQSESDFHGAILKASHNEFLGQYLPMLTETIEKTISMNYNLEVVAEDAYKDHIMIMDFLKHRDANGLKSAVIIHLHHAVWNEEI